MLDEYPLTIDDNRTYGDRVLDIMQDYCISEVDLLVRESLQNSLDAAKENIDIVKVEFNLREVDLHKLFEILNLKGFLNKITNNVLEVRDSGTQGLTGPAIFKDVTEVKESGNYLKLVRSLGVNQQQQGAGGSWGLGKTVFYRMGIGLVLYYSKISISESRLVACLVENQNLPEGLLRKKGIKTGVCWWGKVVDKNLHPVTETKEIKTILDLMGVKPYGEHEVGTSIIIPSVSPAVSEKFKKTITNSVCKWYTARLCNSWQETKKIIKSGPQLQVLINSEKVNPSNEPVFKIINLLHRYGVQGDKKLLNKWLSDVGGMPSVEKWHRNEITYKQNNIVGWFSWVEILGSNLCLANGKSTPDEIFSIERDEEKNLLGGREGGGCPLVAMTRSPGMIVQYVTNERQWGTDRQTDPNTWIMGLFIVNSNDKNIEEYFRSSENAIHMLWQDKTDPEPPIKYIRHIQSKIKSILDEKLKTVEPIKNKEQSFNLSRQIADIFMPKDGFGKRAYSPPAGAPQATSKIRKPRVLPKIYIDDIDWDKNRKCIMKFTAIIPPGENAKLEVCVAAATKLYNAAEWNEQCGMAFPFVIDSIILNEKGIASPEIDQNIAIFCKCTGKEPSIKVSGEIRLRLAEKDLSFALKFG